MGLSLHLNPPSSSGRWTPVDEHENRLLRIFPALRHLILEDVANRSEAQVWLRSAVARLPVDPDQQCQQFCRLLPGRSGDAGNEFARQVLGLLCERRARKVAAYVARDAKLLRQFFRDQPRRVVLFFEHFSMSGEFTYGARALSRFAFARRDTVWEFLEWMGKHAQAPVTVASKPHYFCELHVLRTIRTFVENVPEFWSSSELVEEVESGDILNIDRAFFVEALLDDLCAGREVVLGMVEEFLREEQFPLLCQKLLPLVSSSSLLTFLDGLTPPRSWRLPDQSQASLPGPAAAALAGVRWETLDDAILHSALACNGRGVMQMVAAEDPPTTSCAMNSLLEEMTTDDPEREERLHWAACERCVHNWQDRSQRALIVLQAFLLRVRLHKLGFERASDMAQLLADNGIQSELVHAEMLPSPPRRRRRKHKSKHKRAKKKHKGRSKSGKLVSKSKTRSKRRRARDSDSDEDDSSSTSSDGSGRRSSQESEREWQGERSREGRGGDGDDVVGVKVSTDGYTLLWSNAGDLIDHLVEHSMSVWLKAASREAQRGVSES